MAGAAPGLLLPTSAKQLLRDDDSLLRQIFFNVLRHHQPNTATKVDVIYALSQAWCSSKDNADFDMLEKYLGDLKPEECILVRGWRVLRGVQRGGAASGVVGARRPCGRYLLHWARWWLGRWKGVTAASSCCARPHSPGARANPNARAGQGFACKRLARACLHDCVPASRLTRLLPDSVPAAATAAAPGNLACPPPGNLASRMQGCQRVQPHAQPAQPD